MPVATMEFIRNLGQVLRYKHAGQVARDRAREQLIHISTTAGEEARKQALAELATGNTDYTASGIAVRRRVSTEKGLNARKTIQ